MAAHAPEWVKDAVFYQILPDRFARSPRLRHPRGLRFKPWGSPPEEEGFHGGDLLGVVDKLDYVQGLGVNALYLNPVFASASNHRYHTYDYYTVDPLLGGNAGLRELLDAAHSRKMRVILDGVFNHASRGFWAFHHILENGGNSPYLDWFYIHGWPLYPYPPSAETDPNYAAWWGLPALPKMNVTNPGVRDYLLDVAAYWIEFGADGWRLDVPEEIEDPTFWPDFRRAVRRANPDAYLVGEIWHDAQAWLKGDRFDATMNYVLSRAALGFFGAETLRTDYKPGGYTLAPLDAADFGAAVEHALGLYTWDTVLAQLNLLDSHDTARALWTLGDDETALRLCVIFQMTMPGAPCIYYGDEIGMSSPGDPHCRATFPWEEPHQWDQDLAAYYRKAIALRHAHPALRIGTFRSMHAANGAYAFLRETNTERMLVFFNVTEQPLRLTLDDAARLPRAMQWVAVWGEGRYRVRAGRLMDVVVPPREALVLAEQRS